jgi:hypothetical protein
MNDEWVDGWMSRWIVKWDGLVGGNSVVLQVEEDIC